MFIGSMRTKKIKFGAGGQIERDDISSSNLLSAGIDERFEILEVEFKHSGEIYRYWGVTKGDYDAMLAAGTPGQFFYHHIRLNYPYVRMQ